MPYLKKLQHRFVKPALILGMAIIGLGVLCLILVFLLPSANQPTYLVDNRAKGYFQIKTPREIKIPLPNDTALPNIIVDTPRILQLTKEEIEEKLGKPKGIQLVEGNEERLYFVHSGYKDYIYEFNVGYFNGKPLYCRLLIPSYNDWQSALTTVGIDTGGFYAQKSSTGMNYWFRGEFENRFFDITAIIFQEDDVSINSGIDAVLVKIYRPDEIIIDSEKTIKNAKAGRSRKMDLERVKDRLQTISSRDVEYERAQRLIIEADEILPTLAQ